MISKRRIFFWSPMLSHVGTIKASEKSAESLKRYLDYEIYLVNVFGEFDYLIQNKNYQILNIFSNRNWPKTGFFSKIVIYTFSLISIFKLLKFYRIYNPEIIFCNLVGFVPNILKYFYPKLIIINSIQGLPKFNFFRKIIWNIFYTKADFIFTMTEATKKQIINNINYKNKIFKIDNPIISKKIRSLSSESIPTDEQKYFKGVIFCSVGRLTQQKNFLEVINAIKILPLEYQSKVKLLIIGNGEEFKRLDKFIKKNNLNNIHLAGFKKNPYKYIKNSDYFISSSLWEEPGHAILEAGYLNKLIISSDCPNGPKEILKNNFNSIKYKPGDCIKLSEIIKSLIEDKIKNQDELKLNMKKLVKNYTMLMFAKKLKQILD